ncbi:MAG: ATP-binding protein [Bacteroidetes bacterium]|nr:ATP-binding protein [Bacteroidota bacterium]
MQNLIGRKHEIEILLKALKSNKSELIAIYGRRRVGKTFLVREVYKNYIQFEIAGIHNVTLKQQLHNFHLTLSVKNTNFQKPSYWIEAFHQLGLYLNKLKITKKKVIFIDEFPWLDTRKSKFLPAFDNFWNSYASKRDDLVVVICGSAASYMIQNIIKSKGGLHNRLTEKIQLAPFNLYETEQLFRKNKVKLSRYDILQIYMAMGGIPHYLERISSGESVAQAINRLCFRRDGFLRSEFENIFASLFEQHENHALIIRTLASIRKGLTRTEIVTRGKIASGGTLTKTLTELEESGFIEKYIPYQGNKDAIYRLSDEYSMFYIKYIENTKASDNDIWMKMYQDSSYKIWSGFSFETICMKHLAQIKEGLKISGINAFQGSWIEKNSTNSAQIDLLIDRDDNVINLCEMKFYNTEYAIDKKYANEIAKKVNAFSDCTKTKKSVFVTFITTYGLIQNQYSKQYVQNELTMDHLFIDL